MFPCGFCGEFRTYKTRLTRGLLHSAYAPCAIDGNCELSTYAIDNSLLQQSAMLFSSRAKGICLPQIPIWLNRLSFPHGVCPVTPGGVLPLSHCCGNQACSPSVCHDFSTVSLHSVDAHIVENGNGRAPAGATYQRIFVYGGGRKKRPNAKRTSALGGGFNKVKSGLKKRNHVRRAFRIWSTMQPHGSNANPEFCSAGDQENPRKNVQELGA
jgi:hypothetical protein